MWKRPRTRAKKLGPAGLDEDRAWQSASNQGERLKRIALEVRALRERRHGGIPVGHEEDRTSVESAAANRAVNGGSNVAGARIAGMVG